MITRQQIETLINKLVGDYFMDIDDSQIEDGWYKNREAVLKDFAIYVQNAINDNK